jgi:enamine deaminase RidA (YjgF/YER057c/UK114 family)
MVVVAGTTAADEQGLVVGVGDPHAQTMYILEKIKKALAQAGAGLEDVVRTRMFVTQIEQWEAIGRAHGEFFREVRPAATLVEISRLIDPQMLVEIEVEALLE